MVKENKCPHAWSEWIAYEEMMIEWGTTNGFGYRRTCNNMGCYMIQRTADLIPVGKFEEVEDTFQKEKDKIYLDKLAQDAKEWNTGVRKPTDPEWEDVDPKTGALIKKD